VEVAKVSFVWGHVGAFGRLALSLAFCVPFVLASHHYTTRAYLQISLYTRDRKYIIHSTIHNEINTYNTQNRRLDFEIQYKYV
jgi:hypothetical protein